MRAMPIHPAPAVAGSAREAFVEQALEREREIVSPRGEPLARLVRELGLLAERDRIERAILCRRGDNRFDRETQPSGRVVLRTNDLLEPMATVVGIVDSHFVRHITIP